MKPHLPLTLRRLILKSRRGTLHKTLCSGSLLLAGVFLVGGAASLLGQFIPQEAATAEEATTQVALAKQGVESASANQTTEPALSPENPDATARTQSPASPEPALASTDTEQATDSPATESETPLALGSKEEEEERETVDLWDMTLSQAASSLANVQLPREIRFSHSYLYTRGGIIAVDKMPDKNSPPPAQSYTWLPSRLIVATLPIAPFSFFEGSYSDLKALQNYRKQQLAAANKNNTKKDSEEDEEKKTTTASTTGDTTPDVASGNGALISSAPQRPVNFPGAVPPVAASDARIRTGHANG